MIDRFVLRPGLGIIETGESVLCTTPDGAVLRFDGDSAGFASEALTLLRSPSSAENLTVELSRRAGSEVDRALVNDLLQALSAARVVIPASTAPRQRARTLEGVRVLLALSGAISASEGPRIVHALQRRGAIVRVALSRAARRFVSRWTLQALTHEYVHTKILSRDPRIPAPHIELGRWADAVLVAPASATTLSRIARGDCSDLVAALAVASPAPVLLSPSMNERMLNAPSTQRNLDTLRSDGFHILRASSGIEVADEPGGRSLAVGATLDAEALVRAFDAWYQHMRRAQNAHADIRWDEIYCRTAVENLPWIADGLEDALRSLLLELAPPPGAALDVGCGLGFQSRALAEMGYATVGIDASKEAIRRAAAHPSDKRAFFIHDDILDSKIEGCFDLVLDRGTFHSLPKADQARYAKTIGRLTRPGSILALIHDGPEADPRIMTQRMSHEELESAFAGFQTVANHPATLRRGEPERARCTILRCVAPLSPKPETAPAP